MMASLVNLTPEERKLLEERGYVLAARDFHPQDTIIKVKNLEIGNGTFTVIAGPCAVESREHIFTCAQEVSKAQGHILRGGCFKPRTSPYSFQGLGYEGLEFLAEAGNEYHLPIITEVVTPEDVKELVGRVDILQVGARNMGNFALLKEVGRARHPVFLKRGVSASIDELLQAAEYILAHGNGQVILCERGIRTFETATRCTLDLSAVPVLKSRTHLPIFVDPSHAAGDRTLVPSLALAAKAVGAHGIMIEIHPNPSDALSDGPQSLYFDDFEALMLKLA